MVGDSILQFHHGDIETEMKERKKREISLCEIALREFLGISSPPHNVPKEPARLFWQAWAGSKLRNLLVNLNAIQKSYGVLSAVATSMESGASGAYESIGGSSLKAAVETPMGLSEDSPRGICRSLPEGICSGLDYG
jgi:hypothetical protein